MVLFMDKNDGCRVSSRVPASSYDMHAYGPIHTHMHAHTHTHAHIQILYRQIYITDIFKRVFLSVN